MDSIRKDRRVFIMEGYTDVIMANQQGVTNSLAVLGTAVGEQHLKRLKGIADQVVLVLDGDEAGKVVVLGAKPVEHPGSEAGPYKLEAAGVQLREALWVGRHVPVHPVQEAELVGMTGKMGKKI